MRVGHLRRQQKDHASGNPVRVGRRNVLREPFPGGSVLWGVSVRCPNACRVKNGAFWISKIDEGERDAKFGNIHPFMVWFNNPRDTVVPYVGMVAIVKGYKASRAFKAILESVDANIE